MKTKQLSLRCNVFELECIYIRVPQHWHSKENIHFIYGKLRVFYFNSMPLCWLQVTHFANIVSEINSEFPISDNAWVLPAFRSVYWIILLPLNIWFEEFELRNSGHICSIWQLVCDYDYIDKRYVFLFEVFQFDLHLLKIHLSTYRSKRIESMI